MLRIDKSNKMLFALERKTLRESGYWERRDVQEMICHAPSAFCEELGHQERFHLIGSEIRPTDFVENRIDLLAVDPDGGAVIIELKRDSDKLQLLQALSYAGMVDKWEPKRFIEELFNFSRGKQQTFEQAREELEEFLDEGEVENINRKQRVILLAEAFDYEVLVTAEWLTERYDLDIRCYRLQLAKHGNDDFLVCTRAYPPPELTEFAIRRRRKKEIGPVETPDDWPEALLETFGRVVDRVRSLPVLLIVTFRSEFEPPWIGRPYVTALTLNRLAQQDIEVMIDGVVGNKFIPTTVRHDIVERTDGIPLFVEEMTKAVLEAGSEEEAQRTAATVPSTAMAVPASLYASLMARLDRLGPAKEVAQIGAAIGREFSHVLLSAVVSKPEADLNSALNHLISAGLASRQGVPPHATYLFKHALVQDAAYGTLLREPRRALHARIAETLEGRFTDIAEAQPELLARHCTEAGLIEKAARLWGKAGQRSLARAALLEGAEQLKRALDQIATLPTTPDLRGEEITLRVAFANALALTGDFVNGKEHYDRALAIYDPAEHRPIATRSGRDVGVTLLSFRSACLWLLGYPAASRNDAERAVKNARETGQATTLMYALWFAGDNHMNCGNYAAAHTQVDELIALADESAAPYWKAAGTAVRGWLFAHTGNASDAVRAITSGITSLRSTGAALYEPRHLSFLAMAYAELGQLDDAWRCIDGAIEKVERSKEKWGEAEVHRIAGEIALKSPARDPEKAEAYFDRALSVARQQQAKSWELRAATSMARLWRDQGKRDEARDLLAPVYGWFTEGFDTPDLKEAKALLQELSS